MTSDNLLLDSKVPNPAVLPKDEISFLPFGHAPGGFFGFIPQSHSEKGKSIEKGL